MPREFRVVGYVPLNTSPEGWGHAQQMVLDRWQRAVKLEGYQPLGEVKLTAETLLEGPSSPEYSIGDVVRLTVTGEVAD